MEYLVPEEAKVQRKSAEVLTQLEEVREDILSHWMKKVAAKPYRCCCGSISSRLGTKIIAFIEILFVVIFALELPEYLYKVSDGWLFYTEVFLGNGATIFTAGMVFVILSLLAIISLILGVQLHVHQLILPHILWQMGFILSTMAIFVYFVRLLSVGRILSGAAYVIFAFCWIPVMLELWWLSVVIDCFRCIRRFPPVQKSQLEKKMARFESEIV